jgi:hypothetical protein
MSPDGADQKFLDRQLGLHRMLQETGDKAAYDAAQSDLLAEYRTETEARATLLDSQSREIRERAKAARIETKEALATIEAPSETA